jgi:hypothetical protein
MEPDYFHSGGAARLRRTLILRASHEALCGPPENSRLTCVILQFLDISPANRRLLVCYHLCITLHTCGEGRAGFCDCAGNSSSSYGRHNSLRPESPGQWMQEYENLKSGAVFRSLQVFPRTTPGMSPVASLRDLLLAVPCKSARRQESPGFDKCPIALYEVC